MPPWLIAKEVPDSFNYGPFVYYSLLIDLLMVLFLDSPSWLLLMSSFCELMFRFEDMWWMVICDTLFNVTFSSVRVRTLANFAFYHYAVEQRLPEEAIDLGGLCQSSPDFWCRPYIRIFKKFRLHTTVLSCIWKAGLQNLMLSWDFMPVDFYPDTVFITLGWSNLTFLVHSC